MTPSATVLTFLPYLVLRLHGARKHLAWASETGIDILAVAAVFMFPRLVPNVYPLTKDKKAEEGLFLGSRS